MFGIWKKTSVSVMCNHPFFIELMFSLKYKEGKELCQTACTDGKSIEANPEFIGKLQSHEQLFVLLHEFMHIVLMHPLRRNGRDHYLWNAACDYAANDLLVQMGLRMPTDSEGKIIGLHDEKYRCMTAEKIYTKLQDEANELPKFNLDLKDMEGSPEEKKEIEAKIQQAIVRGAATAKAIGSLPGVLENLVGSALASKEEPWEQHLHRWLQSAMSFDMTWERINRRIALTHGVFAPDFGGHQLGKIAILCDTSGSCFSAAEQNYFCSHVNAILEDCNPEEVRVYYFDTQINSREIFGRGEVNVTLRATGGGGTDFREIFNEVKLDDFEPQAAIVLTDLEGPTGEPPDYPVIWAITSEEEAPFGDSIYLRGGHVC